MAALSYSPAARAAKRKRAAVENALGYTIRHESGVMQLNAAGDYAVISGPAALEQRVLNRLRTKRGSWVLRPEYGGGLEDLVNKPWTATRGAEMERDVRDTLSYEPGIKAVLAVEVTEQATGQGVIVVVGVTYESIAGDEGGVSVSLRRP